MATYPVTKRFFLFALFYIAVTLLVLVAKYSPEGPTEAMTVKDGSVLFWQDGFLVKPIVRNTGSNLTHAAIILNGYVFEAVPPCVHKVPVEQYLKHMAEKQQTRAMQKRGFRYFVLQPKTPYTAAEVKSMAAHAESQLGRPYMLRGWNKRITRGIFCSQLVADVLEKGNRIKSGSFRESPGSLYDKLVPIYE